ncbi:MAG: extracellular solute-binding protein [Candidatus Paceibacterota bacterium]
MSRKILNLRKDLLDSFAFGGTPDIFFLSNDLINIYADKVIEIPYQGFTQRMFADTYIQAADVFKRENGILGYPFLSDPLIMFYNKDHFDSKGIVAPPKYWKDFATLVPQLTEKNEL